MTPRILTRRVACSAVKNAYNRRSVMVFTWNGPQATIPSACALKNSPQPGAVGEGDDGKSGEDGQPAGRQRVCRPPTSDRRAVLGRVR
jgi:hypothetical protein